jgi:hypothetical protein
MIFGRPVACRASFTAPSTASAPRVAEKEAVQRRIYDRSQLLHQLQHGFMRDDIGLPVQQQAGLLLNGLHHVRVAVPGVRNPDPAGEIQEFISILIVNITAVSAFYYDRCVVGPNRREMFYCIWDVCHSLHQCLAPAWVFLPGRGWLGYRSSDQAGRCSSAHEIPRSTSLPGVGNPSAVHPFSS